MGFRALLKTLGDSLLPSRTTEIYLTRLGNQSHAGTDHAAYQNSWRTANDTNSCAYARARESAVTCRCSAAGQQQGSNHSGDNYAHHLAPSKTNGVDAVQDSLPSEG